MVDFAQSARRQGDLTASEAIRHAACTRLRPILMTNCATMLGAVPLVLASGEGSELRLPLGICIIGGLAVSQLLTLYTAPAVYVALDGVKFRRTRRNGAVTPLSSKQL